MPSYREGFENVFFEAAAVGTLAIVSDIPGPTEAIIDEENAYVVPVKKNSRIKKTNDLYHEK